MADAGPDGIRQPSPSDDQDIGFEGSLDGPQKGKEKSEAGNDSPEVVVPAQQAAEGSDLTQARQFCKHTHVELRNLLLDRLGEEVHRESKEPIQECAPGLGLQASDNKNASHQSKKKQSQGVEEKGACVAVQVFFCCFLSAQAEKQI